ncbi:glycosyl transferase group 1 [Leptolyngbya sp. NIES-3755]|nr:glycosyl transferase group 1 [Leptolyngbya sp. NIES-3755]
MIPTVGIYRYTLLNSSETFVRNQAEALQSFTPYYLGMRQIQGLSTAESRTLIANSGGLFGRIKEYSTVLGIDAQFIQKVKAISPKLIHAHFGIDGAVALPIAKTLNLPLLVTFHGFDITIKDEFATRKLGQRLYWRRKEILKQEASGFIAVSKFIQQKLLDQNFPPDKIHVHYIGVNTQEFQPNPAIERESIVLFVGRLVEKKGCEFLIRAMAEVQKVLPEVKLVVIGEGSLRQSLETLAAKLLRSYTFLGSQPPEVVKSWMQKSKVFSVPSLTAQTGDAEGFGLVFAEAQATGLPVVSFASGGVPEAVAHEETGFLAIEQDNEKLAFYLLQLLSNEALWQKFSFQAQHRVQTLFNLATQTRKLEAIYQSAIAA